MVSKNKICIALMGVMFLQCVYIVKNNKGKVEYLEIVQKEEVSNMYEELIKYDGIRVIEIKSDLDETIGEIEISGSRAEIINKISEIKKYKVIDYEIDLLEEVLKVNIRVK